jgi:hypothetical protein
MSVLKKLMLLMNATPPIEQPANGFLIKKARLAAVPVFNTKV